jgi:hypothetical protein
MVRLLTICLLFALVTADAKLATQPQSSAEKNAPAAEAKLTRSKIRSLRLEPPSLTLLNGRDDRSVLVLGTAVDGQIYDLTVEAVFQSGSPAVQVNDQGLVTAIEKGDTHITVSAAGHTAKLPVSVQSMELPPIGFVRDVEPLLGKIGCNAGTCHGGAKGKNGFKLSLRGYDPEFDYQALINDLAGRRFNRVKVEDSLMLLKPIADVPHEGGQVLKPKSREYNLLKQWIVEGTKYEEPSRRANKIEILPGNIELDLAGRSHRILVIAHYADGTTRDVTREAIISSNNGEVTVVTNNTITALRRGESSILVKYEGNFATQLVTVMGDRNGYKWAQVPEYNFIDKHAAAKWQRMKIQPSELCTDAEFIRRVYLDLTGLPATSEEVRAFLDDKTAPKSKRAKLVADLLSSPDFNKYWANKWADLLQCNSEILGEKGVWIFRQWIENAVAENVPYDKLARTLLLARGSSYQNPEVNYLRALRDTEKMTEDISQTFLGVRFNCNKCHDHPFEKWTQNQYYEFGAYFARIGTKNGEMPGEQIIFTKFDGGEVKHPKNDMNVTPKVPYGTAQETKDGERRDVFVEWMTSKDNPLFAKAMVNRTWSYFFGRGVIDPVDDIRASNPASNPELLDALTADFIKSGFDVRHLMRTICNSRTYQLSVVANKWNEDDSINFSHANPRRLSAEQLLDAVAVATGSRPKIKGVPKDMRAAEIPDGMVKENDFLTLFGRPKRQSACECERTSNVTLSHALNLINGATISEAVAAKDNRISKLIEAETDNKKVVEEIYLSVLNRPPNASELKDLNLGEGEQRLESAQDLAWALLNSPAFLFNR